MASGNKRPIKEEAQEFLIAHNQVAEGFQMLGKAIMDQDEASQRAMYAVITTAFFSQIQPLAGLMHKAWESSIDGEWAPVFGVVSEHMTKAHAMIEHLLPKQPDYQYGQALADRLDELEPLFEDDITLPDNEEDPNDLLESD